MWGFFHPLGIVGSWKFGNLTDNVVPLSDEVHTLYRNRYCLERVEVSDLIKIMRTSKKVIFIYKKEFVFLILW